MPKLPKSVSLEWGEPPHVYRAAPSQPTVWDEVVDRLKTRPRKWAKVVMKMVMTPAAASQLAVRLRKRPGVEVTSRKQDVWIRWVGEETKKTSWSCCIRHRRGAS